MLDGLLPILKPGFDNPSDFRQFAGGRYNLLPFRFVELDDSRLIATNFAGDFVVLSQADLSALVRHELPMHSELYDQLKSKQFLFDEDSTASLDLLACQFRTRHSCLSELTSLFMFVVTLRCEHSCPYCQVSRQSQDRLAFDMSVENAERAIQFMFGSPSQHLKVEFQGGEPLLNFPLIRWIVQRVKEVNTEARRDVRFVIATNLALVTEEILDFCREHEVLISTSLDGPKELHNANRPRPGHDSHEKTIDGIAAVRAKLGFDAVSALMTTTRASLGQPEAIIDEYVRLGFRSIFLRAMSPYGFAVSTGAVSKYTTEEWIEFYERGIRHIIQLNHSGVEFREEYASLILRKILTPFPTHFVDLQSPAGIGLSAIAFNYDGTIYASDEARMLAEMGDFKFRLGHLETHSFLDAVGADWFLEIIRATMTEAMPECSTCGFQPYCGSDPVYHWATQGDIVGMKSSSGFCQKNMHIMRLLFRILLDDPESAKILRAWAQ